MLRIGAMAVLLLWSVSAVSGDELPSQLPPEEEEIAIALAETQGQTIFRHDRAAWIATDAVRELRGFRRDRRVVGWVTEDLGEEIAVTFYGAPDGQRPAALYRATVMNNGKLKDSLQTLKDPEPLTEFESLAVSARAAAVETEFQVCSESYNTVVLPPSAASKELWTVYLIPGTTKSDIVPVGGTHRFSVDPHIGTVVKHRKFTNTCIQLRKDPRAVGLMLTHLLDAVPTETHVFWNLFAGMPMYLATPPNGTIWTLKGGKIDLMERGAPDG